MSDAIPPRPDLPGRPHTDDEPLLDRPLATWRWWEAAAVYLLITFASAFLTLPLLTWLEPEGFAELVGSVVIAGVNVVLLVWWLSRFHPGWVRVIGLPERILPEVGVGAGFGAVLYPGVVLGVGVVVNLVLQAITGQTIRAPRQLPAELSVVGVVVAVVYAVVVAPAHEELFFRGMLFRAIRDRHGFWPGALASGFAFGLVHYVPGRWYNSVLLMAVMVATGAALAYLYERRGTIVAPMVAHATFNVIGLVLIFFVQ